MKKRGRARDAVQCQGESNLQYHLKSKKKGQQILRRLGTTCLHVACQPCYGIMDLENMVPYENRHRRTHKYDPVYVKCPEQANPQMQRAVSGCQGSKAGKMGRD